MDILEEDYQKAVAVVRKCLSGSVSNLQRKLYWGYGRAASAIDRMQDEFIVSPMSASGRRDVYPEEIHELWKELQAAKAQAVPEGFVLVSAEQMSQWGHMANCAEEYGCPECYEARGYAHSLACEINAYFNVSEAQEPAND